MIPLNLWIHKATSLKYGPRLETLLNAYPQDMIRLFGPLDRAFYEVTYKPGWYTDEWGSTWQVLQAGMIGEVKVPALQDIEKAQDFKLPTNLLEPEWERKGESVKKKIAAARQAGQFVLGAQVEVFQRMQFIRGTENLFYDLGERNENVLILRDKVVEYFHSYLDFWLKQDMDAIAFYDDWGSQLALLISPAMWKKIFKPVYRDFVNRIHKAGKYAFFHSDGNILDLYPEFIDLGLDAVNSQVWCVGLDKAAAFAGKMTYWGEIDRQHTLAFGTAEDVRKSARLMKAKLFRDGGLIGQSVAGVDVPLENIEALLNSWNED